MPIRMIEEGEFVRPVVVCDHCGGRISRAVEGDTHWEGDGASGLFYIHKRCRDAFELGSRGDWSACELAWLPVYLGESLELDWPSSWAWATFMGDAELWLGEQECREEPEAPAIRLHRPAG